MSISRRLRFEILRRDAHTCRYCGAQAPDVKLTVDHVIPTTLGGGDDPSNLVTACADCNAGKSSVPADAPIVADVDATAMLFAKAMEKAAEIRRADAAALDHAIWEFDKAWRAWRWNRTDASPDGEEIPRPTDWQASIERFIGAGLDTADLMRLLNVAMNSKVYVDNAWRYFCGCSWNAISDRQELARRLIEDGQV